jgi:hypothetical protein
MCTSRSSFRPDLLPEVSQVVPQLVKVSQITNNVPLFTPMKINNNQLEIIELLPETKDRFCLVFYPDPEHIPNEAPIVREYWSSIRPMIICRDVSGYYLGVPEDSHIVLFERFVGTSNQADAWISQANSGFDESLSYGSPNFDSERVYLRRYRG